MSRLKCRICFVFAVGMISLVAGLVAAQEGDGQGTVEFWEMQDSTVDVSMRGLFAVDELVCWASGAEGTVIKTLDGGESWTNVSVPGAEKLDFRDVHAFDENRAIVISAGHPSRVYRTNEGGENWKLVFEHPSEAAFFDAMSFFDDQHGLAFSDPIDGRLLLIETLDGGETWRELDREQRPETVTGEAGFAASGTCLTILGDQVWIGLGGEFQNSDLESARILKMNREEPGDWQVADSTILTGQSSGVFSLVFPNADHGIAVGGDYTKEDETGNNVAITEDGGKTWRAIDGDPPSGYRSAVAVLNFSNKSVLVCVGPNGTDLSMDFGNHWGRISDKGFHALSFTANSKAGWAVGSEGRIARFRLEEE